MVKKNLKCKKCYSRIQYYDRVRRIIKLEDGIITKIYVDRFKCTSCKTITRVLPDYILAYKHYSFNIIKGFVTGSINFYTYGFEDYPCEETVKRWKKEFKR